MSDNTEGSNNDKIEEKGATEEKEGYPGDVTLEVLKAEIESIVKKIEVETKNLIEKEEVQKVLTLLMAKLAILKSKFVAMTRNKKKTSDDKEDEDEVGVEVELGKEDQADVVVMKKSIENAESIVEKIADKFGILFKSVVEAAEDEKINIENSDNTKGSSNIEEEDTTTTMEGKEITTKKEDYPGDATMEVLKKEMDVIAQKIEAGTKNITEKEEVQKILVPLIAKLSIAKSKFIAMTQKNTEKGEDNEDEREVEVEQEKEVEAKAEIEENSDSVPNTEGKEDDKSKRDERKKARRAKVKKALENAEAAVKNAADKFGIKVFDNEGEAVETKNDTNDKPGV